MCGKLCHGVTLKLSYQNESLTCATYEGAFGNVPLHMSRSRDLLTELSLTADSAALILAIKGCTLSEMQACDRLPSWVQCLAD